MIKAVSDILEQYNPKKGTLETALMRLGITPGADTATDQYGNQVALNIIYENVVWAYRCINYIASNLARLEWKFYQVKGKDKIEVTDDPRLYIFKSPNKYQTPYDFKMESLVRLEMQGEMFWEMDVRNNMLVALYPDWRSEEVEMLTDGQRGITGYRRMLSNGAVYSYPADRVFYLHYINPTNQWRGLSPLRPVRNAAENDLNAVYFNKQFFKQGGRPSGVFSTDEKLTKVEADRLESTVKRKYQSVEQMHELLILWGGLKFESINSMNMTDMQFKELRQMNREEIITSFGLSLEVMGLGEKTFTNVQFYRKMAWTETLIPKNEKVVGLINKTLLPAITGQDDIILEVDYDDVEALKEDRASMMQDYQMGFGMGAVTPNEIRTNVLGLDAIEEPEMDVTYLPPMAQPIGLEVEQPAVSTSTDLNQQPDESTSTDTELDTADQEDVEDEQKNLKDSDSLYVVKKNLNQNERRTLWQNRYRAAVKWQKVFTKEVMEFFEEQYKEINSNLTEYMGKAMIKASVFNTSYWEKRLADKTRPLISATMGDAARQILDMTGQSYDANQPVVRAILGQRVNQFSHFVNETTDKKIKYKIEQALQDNIEGGIAAQRLAVKEVLSEYLLGKAAENRANLIAQTEAMAATNGGIMAGIDQSEEFERKMWLTSRDDMVRETHIPMDGVVVNYNEMFVLPDGQEMEYPQDYNERCVLMATDLSVNQNTAEAKENIETEHKYEEINLKNDQNYIDLHNKLNEEQNINLTPGQLNALDEYKINGYRDTNNLLRNPDKALRQMEGDRVNYVTNMINEMDSDINAKLGKDTILYRGANIYDLSNNFDKGNLVGTIIEDSGFISTSMKNDVIYNFGGASHDPKNYNVTFKILAKKETNVAFMEARSDGKEAEILLRRDSKFKIIETKRLEVIRNGTTYYVRQITMELL